MRKGPSPGLGHAEPSIDQLSRRLAKLESQLEAPRDLAAPLEYSDDMLANVASSVYHARRRRRRYFDAALFGDPAWDMLLDLFVARARGKRINTTSLCLAAEVPETTGLRWIVQLEYRGLVERNAAPDDARMKLICLSREGYRVMRQYLADGLIEADLPKTG